MSTAVESQTDFPRHRVLKVVRTFVTRLKSKFTQKVRNNEKPTEPRKFESDTFNNYPQYNPFKDLK